MKECPKCGNQHDKNGKFCSRSCANSRTWSDDDKIKKSKSARNSKKVLLSNKSRCVNKIDKTCVMCNKTFKVFPYRDSQKFCSVECVNSDINFKYKVKPNGGIREGSGRGKSGWYKGYWCDSSWELAWVIYHLDHNIVFSRNTEGFNYEYENTVSLYYPDFIIGKTYHEIKGYKTERFEAKLHDFKDKIMVWYKEDIKHILEYTISCYGINYIELYDDNPHKLKHNDCLICGDEATNIYCSRKCAGIGNNRNSKLKTNN